MKKGLILILTNKDNQTIVNEHNKLMSDLNDEYDIVVAFHETTTKPEIIDQINHFCFTDDIVHERGIIEHRHWAPPYFLFGHEFYPLFKFRKEYPNYKHYWYLEDDVRFSGNWSILFDYFINDDTDFLSCYMRLVTDDKNWLFSGMYHKNINYSEDQKIASFNPICRFSGEALAFLDNELLEWGGHHEVLIPTLLNQNGFTIGDFGGNGKFIRPDCINRFYTQTQLHEQNVSNNPMVTFRYREIFNDVGILPNKIYHPVKNF